MIPRASYQHPADKAAVAALERIPYLDTLAQRLIDLGFERRQRNMHLASSVKLGPNQLPELWKLHSEACETLGVREKPELYLTSSHLFNACAVGAYRPIVVLNSGLVRLMDTQSMSAVIGHEVGHVHCEHATYKWLVGALEALAEGASPVPLAGLPVHAMRLSLAAWDRSAELSCDRAAAIVTRDPESVSRMLLFLAAGGTARQLSIKSFIAQARDYEEPARALDQIHRYALRAQARHPLAVLRVRELWNWVEAGGLKKVLAGDFSATTEVTAKWPGRETEVPDPRPRRSAPQSANTGDRRGSDFDRAARMGRATTDGEPAGMSSQEMGDRIERWLDQHGGI